MIGLGFRMSGLKLDVSGWGSPVQDFSNIMCLALACHQLKSVTQGHQPPLAAEAGHFPNMVYVYNCIAVNPQELLLIQLVSEHFQCAGREQALLRRNDPD